MVGAAMRGAGWCGCWGLLGLWRPRKLVVLLLLLQPLLFQ